MKAKLLFQNQRLIDLETASITADVSELIYIHKFWKDNKLGPLSHQLLHKVPTDHDKVIADIIKTRIPETNLNTGLKNNRDKILSQMELPQIDMSKISHLSNIINHGFDSFYDLDGDKVTLNEDRLRIYMDKNCFYTDNEDVLKTYDELNVIADLLNKLNEKLKIMPEPQGLHEHHLDSDYVQNFFKNLGKIFTITPKGLKITQKGFRDAVNILLKK